MLDQLLDLGNLFSGSRVNIGRAHVQVAHVALKRRDLLRGPLRDRHAQPLGPRDHLVVDIGVVVDEPDAPSAPLEVTAKHVEDRRAHRVP